MGAGDGAIFTRHTAQVGEHSISYLKGGAQRDLEPVLVLHGMGGAGKWESFHMALGTVTSAYLPVLPGWNEGQVPLAPMDCAELMVQFMDTLELPQVTLVGHSFGGWVSCYLASRHPDRVARLVLVAPMGLPGGADLTSLDDEEFAKRAFGKLGLVATANPYGFGAEFENVRKGPEFERQWKGRGVVAHMRPDASLIDTMRSVKVPTLLVWGREDGIVPPAHGEQLRDAIPNASLVVVDRAGHLPMVERNETMNRLVRDFLIGVQEEIPGAVRVD